MALSTIIESPEHTSKTDLIRANGLLARLAPEAIEEVAQSSRWECFTKGEVIWTTGSEVNWFGLIESGFVKMVKGLENGKDSVLEVMGARQTFGCLGVVEGSGCPLSAQCITDVSLLKIPRQTFLPQYESCMPLQREMMKVSARRFFAKLDLMANLSTGKVDSRIANVLLTLCESYGHREQDGLLINVPLTRQDISDFTGVTIESVIRTMSAWQKLGVIRSDRSMITILKMAQMEEIAHGE